MDKKKNEQTGLVAVRFYGEDMPDILPKVRLFLKEGWHLATMQELIKARVENGPDEPIWNSYHDTTTLEFLGKNEVGELDIVVLEDSSKLWKDEFILECYGQLNRDNDYVRVKRQLFLEVHAGVYGPVRIVPFRTQEKIDLQYWEGIKRKRFEHVIDLDQALYDPLVLARLGKQAEAYLTHHSAFSIAASTKDKRHYAPPYDRPEKGFLGDFLLIDPYNRLTEEWKKDDRRTVYLKEDKEAFMHLVCLTGLANVNSKWLSSSVRLVTSESNISLLAVKDGYDLSQGFVNWPSSHLRWIGNLFIPSTPQDYQESFVGTIHEIDAYGGRFSFTKYPRASVPVGEKQKEWLVTANPTLITEGEPAFLVKEGTAHKKNVNLFVPAEKGAFTQEDLKAVLPESANAYRIIGGGFKNIYPKGKGYGSDPIGYQAVLQPLFITVYDDRRVPRLAELLSDHDLAYRKLFPRQETKDEDEQDDE
jgi:hypothetical protein